MYSMLSSNEQTVFSVEDVEEDQTEVMSHFLQHIM